MTQELLDLRRCLVEERYDDALALVDELEEMSKQSILRNIDSFLVRLIVHLIKNQVEQRLINSWAASISDSILKIQKLNLRTNKTSYYINSNEWLPVLEEALEAAIAPASVEALGGKLTPMQLSETVSRKQVIATAQQFLALTYDHAAVDLARAVNEQLMELEGGQAWAQGS
jgi:hypothetical protein